MRRIETDGIRRMDRPAFRKAAVREAIEKAKPSRVSLYQATQAAVDDRFDELTADGSARWEHSPETDDVLDSLGRLASGPFARLPAQEGMAEVRKASWASPGLIARLSS